MRQTALPFALILALAAPVHAQTDMPLPEEPGTPFMEFIDRMLRGFMTEVEPQMRELERGFEALEPELQGFLERMRDMTRYHPPEVLPNGDILIRRRQADDPPEDLFQDDANPEGEPPRSLIPFEL